MSFFWMGDWRILLRGCAAAIERWQGVEHLRRKCAGCLLVKSYSHDLRERIIQTRQDGISAEETAKRFKLSKRTVERYWKRFNQTGQCAELPRGGRRVSRLKPHLKTLRAWIKAQNDMTLAEMLAALRKLGVRIGQHALWHQINKLGLSYK